ncbi:MAG: plasmid encoded RepA protein [Candidatus Competibacteraceae bacterium]|nr:MAG: plasmid encoded RepA protein [Candidatus Competibacteraceae bacterium]
MSTLEETLKNLEARAEEQREKAKQEGRPTLSVIKRRMIESSVKIAATLPDDILFQHTVFCQTVLPFRDPGPDVRIWEREQGQVFLSLEAGRAKDPQGRFVPVGLPFGPAARLILCHLNTEALQTGSPVIDVKDSLTAFVSRLQGFRPNGQQIRKFKDQLTRLSASTMRLAVDQDGYSIQKNMHIVSEFTLWAERFEGERFLVPQHIALSAEYFESLQAHAVPLDERAVAALAHSAMGLDVYMWLAQRLHRVDPQRGQFIPWAALHAQFGQGYKQIRQFRAAFLAVLKVVKTQYPQARMRTDKGGLMLGQSKPPVLPRPLVVALPPPPPPPPSPSKP